MCKFCGLLLLWLCVDLVAEGHSRSAGGQTYQNVTVIWSDGQPLNPGTIITCTHVKRLQPAFETFPGKVTAN